MAEQEKPSDFGGRVPVMLGVTGHRVLKAPVEVLRDAIRKECRALRKSYPHSPFVILSGLAEGADRLVVDVAIAELEAPLIAILPMPAEDFAADFPSDASKREFFALVERARSVITAPVPAGDAWRTPGEPRNELYAWAGARVAEQSQVLFALWDGQGPRGTGGTAHVVAWFDQGMSPRRYSMSGYELSPLDPPEPGILVHIHAETGAVESRKTTMLPGRSEETKKSDIRRILKHADHYNRQVAHMTPKVTEDDPVRQTCAAGRACAHDAAAAYFAADQISIQYAQQVRRADQWVYGLAVLAFFCFNFINQWPIASWCYLAAAAVMLGIAVAIRLRRTDHRFFESRGLAEVMRVLFFWRLAGIQQPVWQTFLAKHAGAVHWIRHAVRALEFANDHGSGAAVPSDEAVAILKSRWIDDQIAFFERAGRRHARHYRRWIWVARITLALSFLIAIGVAALALSWREDLFHWPSDQSVILAVSFSDLLQALLGVLAAAAVAARGFVARRADLELLKQYASAKQIFEIAKDRLEKNDPEWPAKDILERLGREALLEQSEWLWVRHSRPFEVPN